VNCDSALTIPIGTVSEMNKRLIKHSKEALYRGIQAVKAGSSVLDIGVAIDNYISRMGYVSNKNLTGHGIGTKMHEDPVVFGYNVKPLLDPDEIARFDVKLKAGQIICIEPMITYKDDRGMKDKNGWTWRTRDGRNSAIFEHMVLVTEQGYEVLTTHITRDENNHKVNSKTTSKRAD
jgi:methionyl aminopeptidase